MKIRCDGCHAEANSMDEVSRWWRRTTPFLEGTEDLAKYYCEECWLLMLRATKFGGTG